MITFEDLGLKKFSNDKQYRDYLGVLNKFVKTKSKEKSITHIFVSGSFVRGELEKRSDLDFFAIDPKVKEMVEKRVFIGKIKVDYLVLSKKVILSYINGEKKGNFRLFSKLISEGIKVYGDNSFNPTINMAKKVIKSKIPKLSKATIETNIRFMENQKMELNRLYEEGDIVGFHLRFNHVVSCCFEYYFQTNRKSRPAWKKISSEISDKTFLRLLKDVLVETDDKNMYKKICKLIDYTIKLLN